MVKQIGEEMESIHLRHKELSDNIMKYDIGKNKTVNVNYICTEL